MHSRIPLAVAAALLTLAVGADASAVPPNTGTTVDPDLYVSPDGCEDCYGASLTVIQVVPGCYDCSGLYMEVAAHGEGTMLSPPQARACIAGYSGVCLPR